MKIQSTDATVNITFNTTANSGGNQRVEENFIPSVNGSDTRTVSHMTDFDKKHLPVSEKFLIEAIERANKAISGGNRRFEYSIHEKTKDIMIKVIDIDTKQVIREIPPEKILDVVAKLCEMAGIMVDERR